MGYWHICIVQEYNVYRGTKMVQGFRCSTALGIHGSTVVLGYCTCFYG